MTRFVDIWSKGEVARYVGDLARAGQVKACEHLKIIEAYANTWRPICDLDWASRVPANNVELDVTGYNGPSGYDWPACPADCPHLKPVGDLMTSMVTKTRRPSNPQPQGDPISPDQAAGAGVSRPPATELPPPENVTLPWLVRHVPVRLWLTAVGLLAATFVAGVQASRLPIVRQLFGLEQAPASIQEPKRPPDGPGTTRHEP